MTAKADNAGESRRPFGMSSQEQSQGSTGSIPRIDFTTFILSVSSAAYMGLGYGPEESHPGEVNLELARQNIDLLELMWTKTRGNRTPEEDRLLEQLLFETRMRFVEVEKRNSAAKSGRTG
jgi:hypothetical protein